MRLYGLSVKPHPPIQSPTALPQLPTELWIKITRFLGHNDLRKFIHLHRAFYVVYLENRYHTVSISDSSPAKLFKKLQNLNNPAASGLVRTLEVQPDKVWDALSFKETSSLQGPSGNRRGSSRSTFTTSPHTFNLLSTYLRRERHQATSTVVEPPVSNEVLRQTLISVTKELFNVAELRIHWDQSQSHNRKHPPCCPMLSTFLPLFSSNLRRLSMDIPLSVSTTFVPSPSDLTRLEELHINFNAEYALPHGAALSHPSINTVLPLINGVSRCLKTLSISAKCHSGLSLSSFFRGFGQFPQLTTLSLKVPLDNRDLPDPSGLVLLLSSHQHIQRLVLVDFTVPPMYYYTVEGRQTQWHHLRAISIEALEVLELGFRYIDSRDVGLPSLKSLCQGVSSLKVLEPFLKFKEIKPVISYFSSVERLTLAVHNLSLQLIDLLVDNCRKLRRLTLEIETICNSEQNGIPSDEMRFRIEMRGRQDRPIYRDWGLKDLDIWKTEQDTSKRQRQWTAIKAIAYSVPSVQSCDGNTLC